jgi:phenylalanyl-tRNA synthetase beta chain
VNIIEDLIEEIGRMHDFNKIPAKNPRVLLAPPEMDEQLVAMEKAKNSLIAAGFSEVRNSSFVPDKSAGNIELENPLSDDKRFLRSNLVYHLRENVKANHRFAGTVKIFEIGKVFTEGFKEERRLAAAVSVKSGDHVFRDLRGAAEGFLRNLGLTDYSFVPEANKLRLESDHDVLGYLYSEPRNRAAFFEINFDKTYHLIEGEMEYLPISPYPSILSDASFTVKEGTKANLILEAIANLRLPDLEDVDLIDYLPAEMAGEGLTGFTLRLVFQSMKRTLSDEEANRAMAKIESVLAADFNAQIR